MVDAVTIGNGMATTVEIQRQQFGFGELVQAANSVTACLAGIQALISAGNRRGSPSSPHHREVTPFGTTRWRAGHPSPNTVVSTVGQRPGAGAVQFRPHRCEGWIAEVSPVRGGFRRHLVAVENIERVGDFIGRSVDFEEPQAGEVTESAGRPRTIEAPNSLTSWLSARAER